MATLLAHCRVTTKVDGNQDRVATSFVEDKREERITNRVWKSEYIWKALDLERVKGQRSDYSLLDSLGLGVLDSE